MNTKLSRRHLLAASLGLPFAAHAQAHVEFGPVKPPVTAPALRLTLADGKPVELPALLRGKITALQLMFTGCSATCPIQGAVFAETQQRLASLDPSLRLLSISIDPLGDDPKAMRAWLGKFEAKPQRWSAALPKVDDVDRLFDFVRGRADGPDRHTAQAYVFDRKAQLVYRTADMPDADFLAKLMQEVASVA